MFPSTGRSRSRRPPLTPWRTLESSSTTTVSGRNPHRHFQSPGVSDVACDISLQTFNRSAPPRDPRCSRAATSPTPASTIRTAAAGPPAPSPPSSRCCVPTLESPEALSPHRRLLSTGVFRQIKCDHSRAPQEARLRHVRCKQSPYNMISGTVLRGCFVLSDWQVVSRLFKCF